MTLQQVLDSKANNQQVSYQGQAVTILKANPQKIYATHGEPTNDRVEVTADELSPLGG